MYAVAKILYFGYDYNTESVTPSGWQGNLYERFEVVSVFTEIEPALAQRDFLKEVNLSDVNDKATQAVDFVVFNTEAPLYNVKAVSSRPTSESLDNGYVAPYANSIPFEVAHAMCNFFNYRFMYNENMYTTEAQQVPIKLIMFRSGTSPLT